jgi:SAM-dependent methyltransferase
MIDAYAAAPLRVCPLCEAKSDTEFLPFAGEKSAISRPDAKCAECGSLERHRLVWLYFLNETDLFAGSVRKTMLHIAPEPCLRKNLMSEPLIEYVQADLEPTMSGMVRMDVTDIDYPDDSFDVIYCSHVFEHIPDDRKAMRELCRVLRPSGWAVLQVPLFRASTEEDTEETNPEERKRRFGQFDHVRIYGRDYPDRLRECGFDVEVDAYPQRIGPSRAKRYGLMAREEIFYCRKAG